MATALKHSRQREAILTMLRSRYDHPTAEQLYSDLKEEFPRLSLGTVYRNLSLLESMGEILKISAAGTCERYDGNPGEHYHFVCESCSRVDDVAVPVITNLNNEVQTATGAKVNKHTTLFFGTCKECSDSMS